MPSFAFVLLVVFVAQATGQGYALDPAFEKIDLDQWLVEHHQAHLHLAGSVARAELSFHQRLMSSVEIELDGRDWVTRRGNGTLMIFIQITDHAGIRYQTHGSIELNRLGEDVETRILDYSQRAFLLPGDYQVAIAILDTITSEHVSRQMQFRIEPPPYELPPDSWRDLPPVEFIPREKSPDNWYLPDIRGRLRWNAALHSPTRVNIVLNVAPSVPTPGSRPIPSSGLAALLPTLKALSQMSSSSLSERVALLDLARRRTSFEQNDVDDLDWPGLKKSLAEATTASIDVHSLSDRHHDAQFFVCEVRRLLRASDGPNVLVVLTTSVAFDPGENLEPVSLEGLPPCRVIYIRYRTAVPRSGWRARTGRYSGHGQRGKDVVDQLEGTLEPLKPKLFDVETPEQMRRAIAEVEKSVLDYDK